ncbi:MAG: hypothetical protein IT386_08785, partial [Deltaproteobacteria bacterium]|nr:hypothetical protein [Deltaproteobacteria bacterium]
GQVTAIVENGATAESFTYDGAGRRKSHTAGGVTTSYAHDPLGRLRGVVSESYYLALSYDAFGTLARRNDSRESFLALYFGEWAQKRGAQKTRLVHGPGADNVLAEVSGGAARGLLTDAGGNVVHESAGAGIGSTRRYEAFGAVRLSGGAVASERGFAGRPLEGTSGLVNLRARHYDPATGSFLEPDPLGIDTDQLYAYAASNPYLYGDPTGLRPSSLAQWGAAGAGALTGFGMGAGLSYGAGALVGLAAGTAAAPFVAGGLALAGTAGALYAGYDLAFNGGAANVASNARALWNGTSTPGQAFGTGSLFGGAASGGVASRMFGAGMSATGAAASSIAARGAPSGIFSRAVSQAELDAIKNTGFLRGGISSADNPTFFTQGAFSSATKAQRRLGLTGGLRDFRVDFRITNNPSISGPTRVNPLPGRPGTGGGIELSSPDPVEIELLNVAPLRRPR